MPLPAPIPADALPPPLPTGARLGLTMIVAGRELAFELPSPFGALAVPVLLVLPPAVLLDEPAAAPDFPPSGDTEIRAARFPCGTLGFGAGGPGVAESAMIRVRFASPVPGEATSGAGATSDGAGLRCVARADMALIDICGVSFGAAGDAILIGPEFFSLLATSGAAIS